MWSNPCDQSVMGSVSGKWTEGRMKGGRLVVGAAGRVSAYVKQRMSETEIWQAPCQGSGRRGV